jgi:hypothetical protein
VKVKEIRDILLSSSEEELMSFIKEKLLPSKESSTNDIRNNYHTLTLLPEDVVKIGISRMKKIEEDHDLSKTAAVVISFLVFVLTAFIQFYGDLLSFIKGSGSAISLAVSLFFFVYVISLLATAKLKKSKALYLRELLESIKSKKEAP